MKNHVEQIFRANKFRADDHDPYYLPTMEHISEWLFGARNFFSVLVILAIKACKRAKCFKMHNLFNTKIKYSIVDIAAWSKNDECFITTYQQAT